MTTLVLGGARIRNVPVLLTCRACEDDFEYEKPGQLPKLCGSCRSTVQWCPRCLTARPHGDFYGSQKPGSPCRSCHVRAKRLLTCEQCGIDFERTNRGGSTTQGDRKHLCDECEGQFKWCATCGDVKEQTAFASSKGKRDGRASRCKACTSEVFKQRSDADRRATVAKRYGITVAEWDAMYLTQGGLCACCNQPPAPDSRGLVVDHDHETGRVRALLCQPCNVGIGHFAENPQTLRLAAEYLEREGSLRSGWNGGQWR